MSVNPFESPREAQQSPGTDSNFASLAAERASAVKCYTFTILILAVPAIANLLLFNYFITGGVKPLALFYLLATLNAIGVALVIFGLLLGGVFVLESITRLAHQLFGNKSQVELWHRALYDVLRYASFLALPAAILWAIWLWLFYGTNLPYLLFTVPISILAHLLAAILYVALFWRWYKISKRASE